MNMTPRSRDAETAESLANRLHIWAEDPTRDLLTLQRITADLANLTNAAIRRDFGTDTDTEDYE